MNYNYIFCIHMDQLKEEFMPKINLLDNSKGFAAKTNLLGDD